MKAIKRPIPIEVVQFKAPDQHELDGVQIKSVLEGSWFRVYNDLHNSWIEFHAGDWLNITNPGDVYPIEQSVFADTYDLVEEPDEAS